MHKRIKTATVFSLQAISLDELGRLLANSDKTNKARIEVRERERRAKRQSAALKRNRRIRAQQWD